jgi:peptide/nickel transport system permease protein
MSSHVFIEGPAETGPAISPLRSGGTTGEIAAAGQWTLI